jgi:hypothetical protein
LLHCALFSSFIQKLGLKKSKFLLNFVESN